MANNFVAARHSENGFTLVELLVVVLVVGVLATLAIPSFLNQRVKGQDACAKAMVVQMRKTIIGLQTDTATATFAGATGQSLAAADPSIRNAQCGAGTTISVGQTGGASGTCVGSPTADSYCVAATSVSGTSFAWVYDGSIMPPVQTRACSAPGVGSCLAASVW